MARRTTKIPRPSRRERVLWARAALLLIPLAAWLGGRAAGLPALAGAFLAGLVAGMVVTPLLARATRRVIRWAHTGPLAIPPVRKQEAGK